MIFYGKNILFINFRHHFVILYIVDCVQYSSLFRRHLIRTCCSSMHAKRQYIVTKSTVSNKILKGKVKTFLTLMKYNHRLR